MTRPASRKHLLSDVLHPNVGALQEAGPHRGGDGCQGLQGRGQWSHQAAQWPPQLFALSRMLLDNQHIRMVMRKMLVSSSGFIEMLRRFLMRSLLQPSLCLRLDSLFWKVHPSVVSLARVSYSSSAPWCEHCQKFTPAWYELAKSLERSEVNIADVDWIRKTVMYRESLEELRKGTDVNIRVG